MRARAIRLAGLTLFCVSAVSARALDFSRIERWAGSGTNRAGIVVDWNDGPGPHALAWGFRWDGNATALDMWRAITNANSGLSGELTSTLAGVRIAWAEYRRPSRPGDLLPGTANHDVHRSAYSRDFTGTLFQVGTWTYWRSEGGDIYAPAALVESSAGLEDLVLSNGVWDAVSFGAARRPGSAMPALQYPFASELRTYSFGTGAPPLDWIDGSPLSDASVALGRPTVDTTGDDWYAPATQSVPLVALNPAFRSFEIVSIGDAGSLELAFDHPVLDHPDNPYGLDFIVFGNSYQIFGGGLGWTNGDPNATAVGSSCFTERGYVFVSQDGTNWIAYTNGPYADDFAPTLGRVYDPNNVATNLGPWNAWWGGPTDPTIPVDPALLPSNWSGFTVADISRRYRGGAGGVGFDISALPLAPDENTGHKWIRYVRVERSGSANPEIDAIADVSPLPPYARWRMGAHPWMLDPRVETDEADADADGLPTLLEYALGRDPTNAVADAPFATRLCETSSPPALLVEVEVATNATDVVLLIERTDGLMSAAWGTNGIVQAAAVSAPANGTRLTTSRVPAGSDAGFIRMRARHDE